MYVCYWCNYSINIYFNIKMKRSKKKRWELINILAAWKSGKTDLIFSDVVKYIENDYLKNESNDKKK